ncbi:MAG: hypothetical protein IPK10_08960 [Bacteroidetes bacterium]|nr:hypothetical protein [Bacteroidota bacterium]
MVIVPDPSNINRFYVFCAGVTNVKHGLFYSIVDLSYNGGLGKVVQKNIQIRNDTICDGITAVRHGNGRDWWVIAQSWKTILTNDITAYLINPNGVFANTTQFIGTLTTLDGFKRLKYNIDGNHIYNVSANGLINRFDFDRCTGIFQIRYFILE